MNIFCLILFIIIGIAGLVYKVEAGVFVGLGLIPWQIISLRKSKVLNLIAIIITSVIGSVFFISIGNWLLLFLFLFIELYNLWGHLRTKIE